MASAKPPPITDYVFTEHAVFEMTRRNLSAKIVEKVLKAPEQRFKIRSGRDVVQSRVRMDKETYLLRVFVDVDRVPIEVVTAYRTSKIEKYWGGTS